MKKIDMATFKGLVSYGCSLVQIYDKENKPDPSTLRGKEGAICKDKDYELQEDNLEQKIFRLLDGNFRYKMYRDELKFYILGKRHAIVACPDCWLLYAIGDRAA